MPGKESLLPERKQPSRVYFHPAWQEHGKPNCSIISIPAALINVDRNAKVLTLAYN